MCPLYAKEARERRQRDQESSQSSSKSNAPMQNRVPGIINLKPQNAASPNSVATVPKNIKQKHQIKSGSTQPSTSAKSINLTNADQISDHFSHLTLDPETELVKKLKKLKKKIREIEQIEAKLNSGELKNPERDQIEKVGRKREYLNQIERLEKPK